LLARRVSLGHRPVQNGGAQPHHLIAAPLNGDATVADVVTFDLEPGRYPFSASSATARAVRPTPSRRCERLAV
jgi:hypothetical protein